MSYSDIVREIGAASSSTLVMSFSSDEVSAQQLKDPLVHRSEISDLTGEVEVSVIYSPNKDVALSVNGQFARGQMTSNPMTNWYSIKTGIEYHDSQVSEPDGIKTIMFSKSEHCYYLGTTEGLYRTYNDDFSNCERILSAQITVDGNAEMMAHIHNIVEIGNAMYLVSVTGKTSASTKYMVYDSTSNSLPYGKSETYSGWRISSKLVKSDSTRAVVAFTSVDSSSIIDLVVVDKLNQIITRNTITQTASTRKETQYMDALEDKMFFSYHYSDGGGSKVCGITYTELSNITEENQAWGSQISSIPQLAQCRVYQLRTIGDSVYACCGLSGNDHLGLERISLAGGAVQCESLSGDQQLSSYDDAKDIFYSERAGKWSFCLGNKIYVAYDDNGHWTELSDTGYGVSAEVYPQFNEFGNLATIYARDFPYPDPEDPTKTIRPPETMLESPTTGGGLVATLDDLTVKNIRVDGVVLEADEHGFVDVDVKKSVEQTFQVVDQIPEILEEGKIYFVKKSLA